MVDTALDVNSANPVANKVVSEKILSILPLLDFLGAKQKGQKMVTVGSASNIFSDCCASGEVVFEKSFLDIPFVMAYTETSDTKNNITWVQNVTKNGFSFGAYRRGNNVTMAINWIAIGGIET